MATFNWGSVTRPMAPISFVPASSALPPPPSPTPEEGQLAKEFYESIVSDKQKPKKRAKRKCSDNVKSAPSRASEPMPGTSYDILIDDDEDDSVIKPNVNRTFKREPEIELLTSSSSSGVMSANSSHVLDVKVKREKDAEIKEEPDRNPFDDRFGNKLDVKKFEAESSAERFPLPHTSATTNNSSDFQKKRLRYRFFGAAQKDDLEEIHTCLKNGVGVNELDDFGWSALMVASSGGCLRVVRHLVEIGADKSLSAAGSLTAHALVSSGKLDSNRKRELLKVLETSPDEDGERLESRSVQRIQFCELCDSCYAESEVEHQQSVSHLLRANGVEGGKRQDLSVFGIGEGNRGFRLMVDTMGWDANSGLGKEGEGRRYPIKTQMKSDRKGLGVEKEKKRNDTDKKRDFAASKTTTGREANCVRIMKQNTLTRQEARREEKRNKRWEMNMRRYLSE